MFWWWNRYDIYILWGEFWWQEANVFSKTSNQVYICNICLNQFISLSSLEPRIYPRLSATVLRISFQNLIRFRIEKSFGTGRSIDLAKIVACLNKASGGGEEMSPALFEAGSKSWLFFDTSRMFCQTTDWRRANWRIYSPDYYHLKGGREPQNFQSCAGSFYEVVKITTFMPRDLCTTPQSSYNFPVPSNVLWISVSPVEEKTFGISRF